MKASISITRGESRFDNVRRALDLIADQVDLSGCRQALIKPNMVSTVRQLAATHVDALRAVLEFIRARYDGSVCIAEGAALSPTQEGYERFGYMQLAREFDVQMVDLNASDALSARIFDRRLRPMTVRLARPAVESDFRISVSPPKTHNVVIVTLAIKNMVMGCLVNPAMAKRSSYSVETVVHPTSRIGQPAASKAAQIIQLAKMAFPGADRSDKLSMHQGYPVTNLNIARLAPKVLPHLAVIDGFEGMEGNGPNNGDQVEWHVALAGVDAVAVDHLTASLMGFDPGQIGYLVYCRQLGLGEGVLRQMEIRGGLALEEVQRKFHPHPSLARQSAWQLEDAARWLQME